MFSLTQHHLEAFDNQHDFERLAADILNATGNSDVVLVAPRGGGDGGKDITFISTDGKKSLACVTLRKDIKKKFEEDFGQRLVGEYEKYLLFSTQYLTAQMKIEFEAFCAKLGATFLPQDLEALTSLLDTKLIHLRTKYLHIEAEPNITKEVIQRLRQIINYPEALSKTEHMDKENYLERKIELTVPKEIFYFINKYDLQVIETIPNLGLQLKQIYQTYYSLKTELNETYELLLNTIRELVAVRFSQGWHIYMDYYFLRLTGVAAAKAYVDARPNYDITAEDAERLYEYLSKDEDIASKAMGIFNRRQELLSLVQTLRSSVNA